MVYGHYLNYYELYSQSERRDSVGDMIFGLITITTTFLTTIYRELKHCGASFAGGTQIGGSISLR